ncbi:hypothetical protein Hypma_014898 [Hypsizygus marmoreus]|uniref:Uncharacterized protein n=1 Tax=Hypsizygus marmoreus TaxID=39966 RepID=A0A369K4K4_HYPMA|nr:hypothetical protein Hypma_014898 [Hypsizygus marmoreus]
MPIAHALHAHHLHEHEHDEHGVHGLTYNDDEHNAFPVVLPPQSTHSPVRLLPLPTFGHLHLKHILAHPPDSVLFPFLHGLEGSNSAQNTFFASSSHTSSPSAHPRVPRYRGLVWVVCEDDLDEDAEKYVRELGVLRRKRDGGFGDGVLGSASSGYTEGSESGGSSDFDEDEEEEDEEVIEEGQHESVFGAEPRVAVDGDEGAAMDIDADGVAHNIHIVLEEKDKDEPQHMHPVVQRPAPIQTTGLVLGSFSSASSLSTSVDTTSSSEGFFPPTPSLSSSPPSPTPTPTPPKPKSTSTSDVINNKSNTATSTKNNGHNYHNINNTATTKQHPHSSTPDLALLTATFRPCEILRRVPGSGNGLRFDAGNADNDDDDDDGQWEFVPARVPDGISLRNFGIQVPIYSTLSDIVVYSPKGVTPNVRRLARRLQHAVRRKWDERAARVRASSSSAASPAQHHECPAEDTEQEQEKNERDEDKEKEDPASTLLKYNVYILDADAAHMQADKGVPHLVMRLCGGGVPGGADSVVDDRVSGCNERDGAHTDGTDGHVVELGMDGGYMDVDGQMDVDEEDESRAYGAGSGRGGKKAAREPNTVDFAQREKEEMRDLTKASEIISVLPEAVEDPSSTAHANGQGHYHPNSLSPAAYNPHVGQVFLGNGDDVPLAPEVPGRFRPAGSVGVGAGVVLGRAGAGTGELRGEGPGLHGLGEGDTKEGEEEEEDPEGPFTYRATNDPARGFGYDICIECHDLAPFPSAAHLRAAEEHLGKLDVLWVERCRAMGDKNQNQEEATLVPPRPPPNANAVIHLPFPSSPMNNQLALSSLMPVIRFLEKWLQPVREYPVMHVPEPVVPEPPAVPEGGSGGGSSAGRRWSSVTALMPHFPAFPGARHHTNNGSSSTNNSNTTIHGPPPPLSRTRSFTSPPPPGSTTAPPTLTPATARTRPIKVLIYSADGYTESSVPALCLLMAVKRLALPEAYLELQVVKRRSFFVYQGDLGLLRRVEGRVREDRERERAERAKMGVGAGEREVNGNGKRVMGAGVVMGRGAGGGGAQDNGNGNGWKMQNTNVNGIGMGMDMGNGNARTPPPPYGAALIPVPPAPAQQATGRPSAKSVSFAQPPRVSPPRPPQAQAPPQPQPQVQPVRSPPMVVPSQAGHLCNSHPNHNSNHTTAHGPGMSTSAGASGLVHNPLFPVMEHTQTVKGRPRANTSPWLPSLFGGDHQSWFNDPRFDGSFPSRVLPFLYLGNLNHAANAYMLHALGITHVVSVGECALVPPPHHMHGFMHTSSPYHHPTAGAHYVHGKGPQGSLWFEEREGRIKVLDIKGVCDDGIDTLEPQLEPICDWIDQARMEGGQVLVHCRVGVSRSATVTIAYVMKHLGLPLVDAYLIVRSRRLSVLIQPNMRLLYNLCGWEIKLAKARAGENEENLRRELARTLSWPYLAKEVHALNEKYLH